MDDPAHGDTEQAVAAAFVAETREAIDQELRRIVHCLDQLADEDVWWRPGAGVNSVGTILRHLCGNLRQRFFHGIRGDDDTRDRPSEFGEAATASKEDLLAVLTAIVDQIHGVLDGVDPETLLRERRIQGVHTNGLAAIYSTVTHLEGHALQIAYLTHLRLGDRYEPFWKPETEGQGAG